LLESILALEIGSLTVVSVYALCNKMKFRESAVVVKYLLLVFISGLFMLLGYGILYLNFGSSFTHVLMVSVFSIQNSAVHYFYFLGISLFLGGLLLKFYGFPYYSWITEFYKHCSYATIGFLNINLLVVFLFVSKTAKNYTIIAFSDNIFFVSGIIMFTIGFLVAAFSNDCKVFLSGSSMSLSGYFTCSIGLNVDPTLAFAFACAYQTGVLSLLLVLSRLSSENGVEITTFKSLEGLYQSNSQAAFLVSIILFLYSGFVPFAIFWWKFQILHSLVLVFSNGFILFLVGIIIVSTFFFCFRVVRYMYFSGKLKEPFSAEQSGELKFVFTQSFFNFLCVGLGLCFNFSVLIL
jgi:NADH:ubiquinone oxidoreductase subunit 2 (subunit N)